jgi:RluA family pseudouridine synthase
MLFEVTIPANDAGQRAERYLRKRLPNLGMSRLQSLFRRKEIKVARKPVDRGHMLQPGDLLQVYGLRPEEVETAEQPATKFSPAAGYPPLPVLFEDDAMIVVDKPAGVAAHPGTGIPDGASLIERVQAMLAADSETSWGGEVFSPALVHRLDKDTSGVLLVAKTGPALRALTAALRDGKFRKTYLALVAGHPRPAAGVIDAALARADSAAGAKSRIVDEADEEEAGKHSVTRYKTVRTIGDATAGFALLDVVIDTGRMHQIRAHLAHIGHPIVGDTRYDKPSDARAKMKALGLKRMFLHAAELSWESASGRRTFRAPLPEELARATQPA